MGFARCQSCGRVGLRSRRWCANCAAATGALAGAAACESEIRSQLYPPRELVHILGCRDLPRVQRSVVADRYLLIERVGSGATAAVYRARDLSTRGEVAVKLLHEALVEDEVIAERFRLEGLSLERLRHPNIVRLWNHGICDDRHYIAMEFVHGRSLRALIAAQAPVESGRAIEIVLQILAAAGFSHDRGIIHRDLKPANVIVDPRGTVKVTDFGIASSDARRMTLTGSILGTVEYMSPERLMGEKGSVACDVYSIGIILYELLTGRLPFDDELVPTVALMHLNETPVPPGQVNASIAPSLSRIVMRALEKAPQDRYSDANAFIAALRGEAAGSGRTECLAAAA